MKALCQRLALPFIVALAMVPIQTRAENNLSHTVLYEIALDMNNDGKMD